MSSPGTPQGPRIERGDNSLRSGQQRPTMPGSDPVLISSDSPDRGATGRRGEPSKASLVGLANQAKTKPVPHSDHDLADFRSVFTDSAFKHQPLQTAQGSL